MLERICGRCRLPLPEDRFRRIKSGMNGRWYLDSYCKQCRFEYHRAYMRDEYRIRRFKRERQ